MAGSLGLVRTMACIIPMGTIVMAVGLSQLFRINRPLFSWVVILIGLFFIVPKPFVDGFVPNSKTPEQKMMSEAVEWVKANGYGSNKVIYFDPYAAFLIDKDPWDRDVLEEQFRDRENTSLGVKQGDVVIWDTHFANNEGRTPLHAITTNPDFKVLEIIKPPNPFKVLGGDNYEIYIFIKEA